MVYGSVLFFGASIYSYSTGYVVFDDLLSIIGVVELSITGVNVSLEELGFSR